VYFNSQTPADIYDPTYHCQVLIPLITSPDTIISHHDILLTSRANLVCLIRKWYINRSKLPLIPRTINTSYQLQLTSLGDITDYIDTSPHKRLAAATNAQLGWWRDNLAAYGLPPEETRQLDICYRSAIILINNNIYADLDPTRSADQEIRRTSLRSAVEAAMEALHLATKFSAREFASLPAFDLNVGV
jgi:hypothetical protein